MNSVDSISLRFPRIMLAVRLLFFLAIFILLQWLWELVRGTSVENVVVHSLVVVPATFLINLITPSVHAAANHFSILSSDGGINILNGCEGLEALFLLMAAFAVAPMQWNIRLSGFVGGVLAVFVINQLRILVLFYAYRANHGWFDLLHSTVTPIAVVMMVAAYFYSILFIGNRDQSV